MIVARALAEALVFYDAKSGQPPPEIICSAHQTETAREVFHRLDDLVEANPSLQKRVTNTFRALNREFLRFDNGAVIKIKARGAPTTRGLSADLLLLDEAQILSDDVWATVIPTMSARRNPQAWLLGTPPTENDDGEVFTRIRQQGLAHTARHAWIEWSADPQADLDDVQTWAQANPVLGGRISIEAVESERAVMSDVQFQRERLGVWASAGSKRVISVDTWRACSNTEARTADGSEISLAIDVSPDQETASIATAAMSSVGIPLIDVNDTRRGTPDWVVQRVIQANERLPLRAVVMDAAGPGSYLIDQLRAAGVTVTDTNLRQMKQACGGFFEAVHAGQVLHLDQTVLNLALAAGRKRKLEDAWAWHRVSSDADITPLVAATLALWGLGSTQIAKKPRKRTRQATFV